MKLEVNGVAIEMAAAGARTLELSAGRIARMVRLSGAEYLRAGRFAREHKCDLLTGLIAESTTIDDAPLTFAMIEQMPAVDLMTLQGAAGAPFLAAREHRERRLAKIGPEPPRAHLWHDAERGE